MKRVLVAGVVGGLMILATPTLALSADRHDNGGGHQSHDNRGSDNRGGRGHDSDHRNGDRDHDGGYYYGYPGYYDGYYGGYQDCYHDPSGYTTCEPYGGDYDPGGYNGGYPDPPPDSRYCSHPHSAHSAQCPEDGRPPADHGGGPGGSGGAAPAGMVEIKGLAFHPGNVSAQVGQPVVWHFDDNGTAHTVTADNGSFDSGKRASGDYRLSFPQPGTYSYHCSVHPQMKGQVTVS